VTAADDTPTRSAPRSGVLWIGCFVALVGCTQAANAAFATLVNDHPEWLITLSSRNRYLLAVVPTDIPPALWVLIGAVRLTAAAIVCHMLGRAYGDRALHWFWRFLGMPEEQVAKFEKAFDDAEWFVVPFFVGSNIVWVLSGAARSSWRRLGPLLAIGLAIRLTFLWIMAKLFESQVQSVLDFIDRYQMWVLVVSIAVVVIVNLRNFRGR